MNMCYRYSNIVSNANIWDDNCWFGIEQSMKNNVFAVCMIKRKTTKKDINYYNLKILELINKKNLI